MLKAATGLEVLSAGVWISNTSTTALSTNLLISTATVKLFATVLNSSPRELRRLGFPCKTRLIKESLDHFSTLFTHALERQNILILYKMLGT